MSKAPAFQFYPGDYIQDTRALSLAARGAWQDLLCFMWRSEEKGKLSYSIEGYSHLFGTSIEETKRVIDELVSLKICNTVTECNGNVTLINRRMVRDEKARQQTNDRVKRFRNTNEKRPCNEKETSPSSSSSSFSSYSSTTNTEEKTKEKEVKEKEKASAEEPPPLILPKDIKPDIWKEFVKMRRKIKAPLTEKGSELIMIELDKIGQNKNDVLNQSIRNSWRGVFELHTQGGFNANRNERNNSRTGSRESSQKTTGSGHQGLFVQENREWPEDHREVALG
jgi:hypothetical protein